MINFLESLEIRKTGIMSRARSLSFFCDRITVFPFTVHERNGVSPDLGMTHILPRRAEIVVQLVFWLVVTGSGDVELSRSEAIVGFLDREFVGARFH